MVFRILRRSLAKWSGENSNWRARAGVPAHWWSRGVASHAALPSRLQRQPRHPCGGRCFRHLRPNFAAGSAGGGGRHPHSGGPISGRPDPCRPNPLHPGGLLPGYLPRHFAGSSAYGSVPRLPCRCRRRRRRCCSWVSGASQPPHQGTGGSRTPTVGACSHSAG